MKVQALVSLLTVFLLGGCQVVERVVPQPDPLPIVEGLDLESYMGTWFVIAATPTLLDRKAYNATEVYSLTDEGIQVQYSFNKGGFAGERKTFNFKAKVDNPGDNSDWTLRMAWPIQSDYKIIHLAKDYSTTIVGHPNRRYVWVMARTPTIPDTLYSDLMLKLQRMGYDLGSLRRIPQSASR